MEKAQKRSSANFPYLPAELNCLYIIEKKEDFFMEYVSSIVLYVFIFAGFIVLSLILYLAFRAPKLEAVVTPEKVFRYDTGTYMVECNENNTL